jgi:hypothetical protein
VPLIDYPHLKREPSSVSVHPFVQRIPETATTKKQLINLIRE